MPRKDRRRTMRGGFFDTLTQGLISALDKTKKATTDAYSSATGSISAATSYQQQAPTSYQPQAPTSYQPPAPTSLQNSRGIMGGKTKRRRRMRGGFKDNTPTTGLASHAASFSGSTAQPHNWVGGRTKRRRIKHRHRHTKSCRHRR